MNLRPSFTLSLGTRSPDCRFWRAFPVFYAGVVGSCWAQGTLPAGAKIRFDQDSYTATAKGSSVPLRVLIEPPPVAGLFSFGVRVTFDPSYALLDPVLGARVEQTLNFNAAAGPGALVESGPGFVGLKGTLDLFSANLEPYLGNVLATVNLQNLGEAGTVYRVGVEIFRTVGPTETVFVDGVGRSLDAGLSFGFSQITVAVPEPTPGSLLGVGLSLSLLWGWRGGGRRKR